MNTRIPQRFRKTAFALAAGSLALASPVQAAIINVTAAAVDDMTNSNCSMVEAMIAATANIVRDACPAGDDTDNGGDVIVLPTNASFNFTSGWAGGKALPNAYYKNVIEGNGATITLATGMGLVAGRVAGVDLTLKNLTVTGGGGGEDIVVVEHGGKITIENSLISGSVNAASVLATRYGNSTLDLVSSTISGNTGAVSAVQVYQSYLNILNSTIADNTDVTSLLIGDGTATITHGTIKSANRALYGYGSSDVITDNSIIIGNCKNIDSIVFLDANILRGADNSCMGYFSTTDIDPMLGPLQNNGGPTPTMALHEESPAIDAATGTSPATDQRGVARPQGGASDLGAYEYQSPDTTPNAFSFPNASNVVPGSVANSKPITVGGINTAAPISVGGGEYRINSGTWTAMAGTVTGGQTVQLRTTTPSIANTTKKVIVDIGGVKATFLTKTGAIPPDLDPDALTIPNANNVPVNSAQKSPNFMPAGFNTPTSASIVGSNCTFRVGVGGAIDNSNKTLAPGDELRVYVTAPATNATKFSCKITLGGVTSTWIGKTAP